MGNLAYDMDAGYTEQRRYEMLDGQMYAMASPSIKHNDVVFNVARIFKDFLKGKRCSAHKEAAVFFSKNDRVIPDLSVVCDRDKLKPNGIHGAPDLVVEVLSPSNASRDKGYKRRLYERHGVKEYWIIDAESRLIDVYVLKDGRLEPDGAYAAIPDYVMADMTDEEKSEIVYEFKTVLFDDLVIKVEDVFDDLTEIG